MALSGITEQLGRVLGGRYRLTAPVGIGSSAQVFLADDVQLRRRVAVKVLHPALAADDAFLRRFRAEARAAAALSHPNLMAVYDWGEDDGPYLVLEFLGGGSLRAMLDAGTRLTPAQAAAVGLDAARALDAAHRRGFVHRDIKPANLLFGDDGRLRIADFGLARALSEAAWTEPGDGLVGTARYAAPEQASSPRVDGKADVYALGLVLIEAVTGEVPLTADTALGTLMGRVDVAVPVPDALGPLRPLLERTGRPQPTARPDAAALERGLLEAAGALDPPGPLLLAGAVSAGAPHADPTLLPALGPTTWSPTGTPHGGDGGTRDGADDGTSVASGAADGASVAGTDDPRSGAVDGASEDTHGAAWSSRGDATSVAGPGGTADGSDGDLADGDEADGTSAHRPGDALPDDTIVMGAGAGEAPVESAGPRVVRFDDLAPRVAPQQDDPAPTGGRLRRSASGGARSGASRLRRAGRGPADGDAAPPRQRRWRRALAVLALLLLLGVGGWLGVQAYLDAQPTKAAVPAVTTLERGAAEAELAAAEAAVEDGLDWPVAVVEEHNEVVREGFVIDQDPEPGTVLEDGETVRLVVSLGPPPRDVPDLFNRTMEEARTDIATAELAVGRTEQVHVEDVEEGRVVTWSVEGDERPAEVPKGSEVDLVVSLGPAPREVPTLAGVPVDDATADLEGLGLVPAVVEQFSSTVDAGLVIGSTPGAGATLARGDTVELAVSKGPDLVTVPDLSGTSESEAIAALRSAGLVAGDANGPAGGVVFASEPRAGASVVRGTRVDLFRR